MKSDSAIERGKGRLGVSLNSADEATNNDQNDMARLGKPQQFNVSISSAIFPVMKTSRKFLPYTSEMV